MKTIKGPAIFLAQFAGDDPPFNSLGAIAEWAAGLGYKGVQIPTWDGRLFDLAQAADSTDYCDEVKGTLSAHGMAVTELSTHLQGQLVAVHPAYDTAFDGFADREQRTCGRLQQVSARHAAAFVTIVRHSSPPVDSRQVRLGVDRPRMAASALL